MTPTQCYQSCRLSVDGIDLLKPALGFCFFFTGNAERHRPGLLAMIDAIWPLVSEGARSFQTANMKGIRKLKGHGQDLLVQAVSEPVPAMLTSITIDDREHLDAASDSVVKIAISQLRNVGYIDVRLPIDGTLPETLVQLAEAAVTAVDLAHGYAGYTLAFNPLSLKSALVEERFFAIGMRHPGVELPSPSNTSFVVGGGLKRVNWLTLLGFELVHRAEGLGDLRHQWDIGVYDGTFGTVVRAGSAPRIGDTNRGDRCEEYRIVGRALAPIRCQTHPSFILGEDRVLASAERTQKWLSSLDQ